MSRKLCPVYSVWAYLSASDQTLVLFYRHQSLIINYDADVSFCPQKKEKKINVGPFFIPFSNPTAWHSHNCLQPLADIRDDYGYVTSRFTLSIFCINFFGSSKLNWSVITHTAHKIFMNFKLDLGYFMKSAVPNSKCLDLSLVGILYLIWCTYTYAIMNISGQLHGKQASLRN